MLAVSPLSPERAWARRASGILIAQLCHRRSLSITKSTNHQITNDLCHNLAEVTTLPTTRRNLLKGSLLTALPVRAARSTRSTGIYQELGIRPVINCRGTHTVLGASKKWPEIDAAMAEASRSFVLLSEL